MITLFPISTLYIMIKIGSSHGESQTLGFVIPGDPKFLYFRFPLNIKRGKIDKAIKSLSCTENKNVVSS